MAHDPRYDILFEPVRIGPVTARNRFFQVPHCNGMGYRDPAAVAEMRAVKAEGGWAVVCTEETEIHPSGDLTPFIEGRLWDDSDIPALALSADKIHEHGALAGIELAHNGMSAANLHTRIPPLGPSHLPVARGHEPVQPRRMTVGDIRRVRDWHRAAVRRALAAGFDIVYVYAGHRLTGLHHFLSPRFNTRDDEYGGSLRNRMRFLREVLEDTVEEVAGGAAVACRLTVDELIGPEGITRDDVEQVIGELGEIPDLWDFVPGTWEDDSTTSRFSPEGHEEEWVAGLKRLTTKPVVGVGRFTSPDTMVRMVRSGVLDFIGAARPSIADPFLPAKIEAGRIDEIRECIGCNVCVTRDWTMSPIRCTQNPAMGEEWRCGWHPERVRPRRSDARVLVVGSGPAGLEAAQMAGKRGYEVVLVEATRDIGGRVAKESRLPGLAAWARVRGYRVDQISRLPNVEVYLDSRVTAGDVLAGEAAYVAVATGSIWRDDGVGRCRVVPWATDGSVEVVTPDGLHTGVRPLARSVVVYDDDHYYLGGVLAEMLAREGAHVALATPAARVSAWTVNTMEQHRIHRRLVEVGVSIVTSAEVTEVAGGEIRAVDVYTGDPLPLPVGALVPVTARLPDDGLVHDLEARAAEWADAGLRAAAAVGDALAPGTIAAAVWDGRRFAEQLEEGDGPPVPFRREITLLGP